jgi:hypothetical protein
MRKKPSNVKRRAQDKNTNSPPINAPSWCLNESGLKKLNRTARDIQIYDYDTDDPNDEDDATSDDEIQEKRRKTNDGESRESRKRRKKSSKQKRRKKSKKSKK